MKAQVDVQKTITLTLTEDEAAILVALVGGVSAAGNTSSAGAFCNELFIGLSPQVERQFTSCDLFRGQLAAISGVAIKDGAVVE